MKDKYVAYLLFAAGMLLIARGTFMIHPGLGVVAAGVVNLLFARAAWQEHLRALAAHPQGEGSVRAGEV